jgi:hypothetical protein
VESVTASDPDWIIICPCGLDLDETKKELPAIIFTDWWKELRAVREKRVVLVDGNQMFNRPGPRLVDALEFLVGLLHGREDLIPKGFPWEWWVQSEVPGVTREEERPAAAAAAAPETAAAAAAAAAAAEEEEEGKEGGAVAAGGKRGVPAAAIGGGIAVEVIATRAAAPA